jgi:DNA invertase Pin-like site-specific DNA recombinase
MMRQIAGSFAQYEKARLVAKLKAARDRRRAEQGKCDGRKSHAEIRPDVVARVKQLRRAKPKGGQLSLRDVAAQLEAEGHLNERGQRYSATSIANMLRE